RRAERSERQGVLGSHERCVMSTRLALPKDMREGFGGSRRPATYVARLETRRRAATWVAWGSWLSCFGAGCAGAAFEREDAPSIDAAAPIDKVTIDAPAGPAAEAATAVESGAPTICGRVRDGDAPAFTREVCVMGATFTM